MRLRSRWLLCDKRDGVVGTENLTEGGRILAQ
jgi:hypothetical protein